MSYAYKKSIPNVGQASGDTIYFDGSDWQRRAKGDDGQILTLVSGIPDWQDAPDTYDDTPVFYIDGTRTITGAVLTSNGIFQAQSDVDLVFKNTAGSTLMSMNNNGWVVFDKTNLTTGIYIGYSAVFAKTGNALQVGGGSGWTNQYFYIGGSLKANLSSTSFHVYTDLGAGVSPTARLHTKGSGATSSTYHFLATNSAGSKTIECRDDQAIGFYGVTPTARQTLATGAGATVDDVITALQTLGLVKQS